MAEWKPGSKGPAAKAAQCIYNAVAVKNTLEQARLSLAKLAHKNHVHLVLLNGNGAPLKVDGYYGRKTRTSLDSLKGSKPLPRDAVVDHKTWGALFSASNIRSPDGPSPPKASAAANQGDNSGYASEANQVNHDAKSFEEMGSLNLDKWETGMSAGTAQGQIVKSGKDKPLTAEMAYWSEPLLEMYTYL